MAAIPHPLGSACGSARPIPPVLCPIPTPGRPDTGTTGETCSYSVTDGGRDGLGRRQSRRATANARVSQVRLSAATALSLGPGILGGVRMGIIAWLLVGLIAGWLAGKVLGGRGFGFLGNIVVGIIGAFLGGFVGSTVFGWEVPGF